MPSDRDEPRSAGRGQLPPGARTAISVARRPGDRDPRVRIVVDIHEQRSGILEGLEALGAEVTVGRLAAGDYRLPRGALVERKRVIDLHTSVAKGRFWPQLLAMQEGGMSAYLLVEGTDLDRGPLHPASVRSLLIAAIERGIPVIRSYQQKDSAVWLYRLALRRLQRGRPNDHPAYAKPRTPAGVPPAEALLAAVPGISTASARALLSRFGSVAGVIKAGRDEWLEVPGIGPERASALEETLSLPFGGAAARG